MYLFAILMFQDGLQRLDLEKRIESLENYIRGLEPILVQK